MSELSGVMDMYPLTARLTSGARFNKVRMIAEPIGDRWLIRFFTRAGKTRTLQELARLTATRREGKRMSGRWYEGDVKVATFDRLVGACGCHSVVPELPYEPGTQADIDALLAAV